MPSVIMLCLIILYAECHCTEHCYAKYHYAECHYTECLGADVEGMSNWIRYNMLGFCELWTEVIVVENV